MFADSRPIYVTKQYYQYSIRR